MTDFERKWNRLCGIATTKMVDTLRDTVSQMKQPGIIPPEDSPENVARMEMRNSPHQFAIRQGGWIQHVA